MLPLLMRIGQSTNISFKMFYTFGCWKADGGQTDSISTIWFVDLAIIFKLIFMPEECNVDYCLQTGSTQTGSFQSVLLNRRGHVVCKK